MLFMSLISDNIHVHVYQKVQKESVTLFSFFKIWQKWYKKTLKNKSCFQWNISGEKYIFAYFLAREHVKQIVPVPLPCLQPIDDMGRDRNTCSRAKVAFGICWQSVHIHIVNMIPWYIIKHYLQKHSKFCTSTVILLLFTFIFYR